MKRQKKKNSKLTKSIVAVVAIAALAVPGIVFAQTKAVYPVDKSGSGESTALTLL